MAERSNAAVLKTVEVQASGGSNPSLSAGVRRKMLFYNILRLAYLVGECKKECYYCKVYYTLLLLKRTGHIA